jgi:hypothetical protein
MRMHGDHWAGLAAQKLRPAKLPPLSSSSILCQRRLVLLDLQSIVLELRREVLLRLAVHFEQELGFSLARPPVFKCRLKLGQRLCQHIEEGRGLLPANLSC